jgi:prolyl 4-hydroxylase
VPNNGSFKERNTIGTYNRLLSTMLYLEDDCTGRKAYFPDVKEVGPSADGGKLPRKGNTVIWNNLFMNGSGDPRLYHASLPVKSGTKVGLNIFSLYYLDLPILGELDYD